MQWSQLCKFYCGHSAAAGNLCLTSTDVSICKSDRAEGGLRRSLVFVGRFSDTHYPSCSKYTEAVTDICFYLRMSRLIYFIIKCKFKYFQHLPAPAAAVQTQSILNSLVRIILVAQNNPNTDSVRRDLRISSLLEQSIALVRSDLIALTEVKCDVLPLWTDRCCLTCYFPADE